MIANQFYDATFNKKKLTYLHLHDGQKRKGKKQETDRSLGAVCPIGNCYVFTD